MRIAVISDTHDKLPSNLLAAVSGADAIWHLGDVTTPAVLHRLSELQRPLRVVRGNCDSLGDWPLETRIVVEGVRILLVHIPPKSAPADTDLVLHGHTHVPRNEVVSGVRFLNPGCISRPNRGAPASYAWLELMEKKPHSWRLVLL